MNDTISPIRGPFESVSEFLDSLSSSPLRLERLNAVEQRLKQDPSILAQLKVADIARMLELMPMFVFEDWVPSEQFLENFYAGNVEYDQSGQMVGGPPDACLDLEDPYEGTDTELSEEAKDEGRKLFQRSDELSTRMYVSRDIMEHFRRTLPTANDSEKLLGDTKFWPLLEDLDYLGSIYGASNPVIESMDFLSLYLSPNPGSPKGAREKLKEILRFIFDHSQGDSLSEIISIARYVVDGGRGANIFSLLRERFNPLLSSASTTETTNETGTLQHLFEHICELDRHMLSACLATIPRFFERIEERHYGYRIFHEDKREDTATQDKDLAISLEAYTLSLIVEIASDHGLDMSRSSIASMEMLGDNAFSNPLDPESPTIFDVALEAKKSEDDALDDVPAPVLIPEILALRNLIYSIEKARMKQIASGNPVFLDARGLFPHQEEFLALPRKTKKPKLGVAISLVQVLLRNRDGYHCSDFDFGSVLFIAEGLRNAGFARIGANILAMFFEVRLSEIMKHVTEGETEQISFSYKNVVRLFEFYAQLYEDEKTTMEIAIGRLFPELDFLEQKRFRGLFRNSVLDNRKYGSAVATLTAEIGKERWEKLKDSIKDELEDGENLYRFGVKKDWQKTSSRAPVNHWAAALEGIFYEIWSQSFDELRRDELNDPTPRKLDSGTASLAEMVNFLLDVPKRLKKSEPNIAFLDVFQTSKFSQVISQNEDFRRQLRMLGAIRGKAAHYSDDEQGSSKISPTDVFAFRHYLFSSGLLAALIDVLE